MEYRLIGGPADGKVGLLENETSFIYCEEQVCPSIAMESNGVLWVEPVMHTYVKLREGVFVWTLFDDTTFCME